ncbi:hypothetical protein GPX89_07665 [Nocardia sp. ET3-3]|uniref:Uncharacterized protein n=1 Tax=Nocardia terrae TaxID=2675851 RepID=A0A7K1US09_9NOCA|nr:hypothetical protein [Nocardia terrae]MVU77124.1 hypothetical protein [Nocardia terrae]
MTRYEIGAHVVADDLKTGDLFGEDRIEAIAEHADAADYVEALTITLAGGGSFTADTFEEVVVPHRHTVTVTVAAHLGLRFEFACHSVSGECRRSCARCNASAARCRCPDPQPRAGACRLITRCNSKDVAALLVAYDGDPAPVRSGPVMLYPTPDGVGCLWRYPDQHTD